MVLSPGHRGQTGRREGSDVLHQVHHACMRGWVNTSTHAFGMADGEMAVWGDIILYFCVCV